MSEQIDWSKAPEGASHYVIGWGFFKLDLAGWFICDDGEKVWRKTPYQSPDNFSWWGNAVARPTTPSWSGEGLPPVGVDLQWFSSVYGWIGGKVVAHDEQTTIVRHNDGYEGCYLHNLKPCKTTEQIAADEREAAVAEMLGLFGGTDSRDTYLMRRLYDAGYRKQSTCDPTGYDD